MASKNYKLQPVMLAPRHIAWLTKVSKKSSTSKYVSRSEIVRYLIEVQMKNDGLKT